MMKFHRLPTTKKYMKHYFVSHNGMKVKNETLRMKHAFVLTDTELYCAAVAKSRRRCTHLHQGHTHDDTPKGLRRWQGLKNKYGVFVWNETHVHVALDVVFGVFFFTFQLKLNTKSLCFVNKSFIYIAW